MKTRKLLLVVVLALVITVSGVYATWNYAEKDLTATSAGHLTIDLSGKDVSVEKGTLSFAGNIRIEVDQLDSTYKSKVVSVGDSAITVTFTPNAINAEVVENGVNLQWYMNAHNTVDFATLKYGATPIIAEFNTAKNTLTMAKQLDGTFVGTITADEILTKMVFSQVILPSEADYDAYELALNELLTAVGKIGVMIEEVA